MKKLMMIVNPVAGSGGYKLNFGEGMRILSDNDYATALFFTRQKGDATRYAREYGKKFDQIACIGGDGTLSEVLAGLMGLEDPPSVGYIPMGTANDVATTLRLPKNDIVGAVKVMIAGEPHPFDVGGFGDNDYFASIAAIRRRRIRRRHWDISPTCCRECRYCRILSRSTRGLNLTTAL